MSLTCRHSPVGSLASVAAALSSLLACWRTPRSLGNEIADESADIVVIAAGDDGANDCLDFVFGPRTRSRGKGDRRRESSVLDPGVNRSRAKADLSAHIG